MARKPKSFKLDEKKKVIILYTNVRIEAENDLINFYLDRGYAPMYEEKKDTVKIKEMRDELKKKDEKALAEFNRIYAIKVDANASKEEKKNSGFFGACKLYNEWKKANKQAKEEANAEAEE